MVCVQLVKYRFVSLLRILCFSLFLELSAADDAAGCFTKPLWVQTRDMAWLAEPSLPFFFLSLFFFSLHIISVPWAYRSTKNESNHAREIVSIGHVESSWFSLVQKSLGWSEMCRGNRNAGKKTQKTKLGSFLCFREISRVIFVDRTTGTIIQLLQIVIYITVQGFGIVQVENWRL